MITFEIKGNSKYAPVGKYKGGVFSRIAPEQYARKVLALAQDFRVTETKKFLRKQIQKGFDPDAVRIVDGSRQKRLEDAKPFGTTEYFSRGQSLQLLKSAYEQLYSRSPTLTGQYRQGHLVFLNGRLIARTPGGFKAWLNSKAASNLPIRAEFAFVNNRPYARKLERYGITINQKGKAKGQISGKQRPGKYRGNRVLRPNGVYYQTYRNLLRESKGFAEGIDFKYLASGWRGINIPQDGFRRDRKGGGSYIYPTILIRLRGKSKPNTSAVTNGVVQ